jgi:hypothetical protein
VVEGWTAWRYLQGRHEAGRWADVIKAGESFHREVADAPRPDFIDGYTDPWANGDRVAWGEQALEEFRHVKHIARLAACLRPVSASSQLIHGDLTGNVLFHDHLPPAVIDLAPTGARPSSPRRSLWVTR